MFSFATKLCCFPKETKQRVIDIATTISQHLLFYTNKVIQRVFISTLKKKSLPGGSFQLNNMLCYIIIPLSVLCLFTSSNVCTVLQPFTTLQRPTKQECNICLQKNVQEEEIVLVTLPLYILMYKSSFFCINGHIESGDMDMGTWNRD